MILCNAEKTNAKINQHTEIIYMDGWMWRTQNANAPCHSSVPPNFCSVAFWQYLGL